MERRQAFSANILFLRRAGNWCRNDTSVATRMTIDAQHRLNRISPRVVEDAARLKTPADVETIVYTFYDDVYRLALTMLNDENDAQDATQETFIAAAEALDTFRGEAALKTWLFSIAINECRRLLRASQRRNRVRHALQAVQSFLSPNPTPEDAVERTDRRQRLKAAVIDLPERHRLPVLLRYVHNLTASEIGEVLGISEGTVYSRLHYARQQLRRTLNGQK